MNILTNVLINKEDKSRAFIAVSKRCCYLCELYIRFARTKGYVIDISGNISFPDANNDIFYDESLSHVIRNLNRTIKYETKNFTEMASSVSGAGSVGSGSHIVNQFQKSTQT